MIPDEIISIGDRVTLKTIRNAILDLGITEKDTISVNQITFDNIALEHRETYKESITIPYLFLGVLIKEDVTRTVPHNRIGIILNDTKSIRVAPTIKDEFSEWFVAFRCGWCGNIVDGNGNVLEGTERTTTIRYIENYPNPTVKLTDGNCCPNG